MKVYKPVGDWSFQESMNRPIERGGRVILEVSIKESRFIHAEDSDGQGVAFVLRPNHAVCRQVEQPDAPAVPADIAEILRDALNYFKRIHAAIAEEDGREADPEAIGLADKGLAWLAALGQEA